MAIENCILGLLVLICSFQTIVSQIATACAGAPNGAFVRNSQSCQAYYYCSDGEAHANECPENYLFEPIRQVCHIASYVQCTGCSPFGVQHIAHPTDCSSYYLCVAGIRTLQKCRDNLIFDNSIGDCNAASTVQCIRDTTQICAEFGGYVKIGDPDDCSKFYSCLYGVAYHQSCAPGLFFKPDIASCTFPEEYDFCQGDGSIALPSDADKNDTIVLVIEKNDVDVVDLPINMDGAADVSTNNHSDGLIDLPSDTYADVPMYPSSESNSDQDLASNSNTYLSSEKSSEILSGNSNEVSSHEINEVPSDVSNEIPSNYFREGNSAEVNNNDNKDLSSENSFSNEVSSGNSNEGNSYTSVEGSIGGPSDDDSDETQ